MERVLDFVVILASHCRIYDYEDTDTVHWNEHSPLDPDGFAVMVDQFGEQVQDGDAQAVNGMEQNAKENYDLEDPVFVNAVYERPAFSAQKRSQNMQRNKDRHPQPANAMQDERQHWSLSLITQPCG
jgi:hypothetical protein